MSKATRIIQSPIQGPDEYQNLWGLEIEKERVFKKILHVISNSVSNILDSITRAVEDDNKR